MSIKIDPSKCIACGKCQIACPGSLIERDAKGRAITKYPQLCWGCTACLKECQVGAIRYYLGADIGGKGTTLYTTKEDHLLHWHIERPKGEQQILTINRSDSNHY